MIDGERFLRTLEALLSFSSPQQAMDQVRAFIADEVRPRAAAAGFDRVVVDDAGNLLAHRAGRNPALLPLVWWTYGATYPAAGMPDPYPAQRLEEGGVVWVRGRGAAEQRTGLAAALEALQALAGRSRSERGYVLVTCIAGEMGNHHVADALLRAHELRAAGVILAVATGAKIGLGNLGRADVLVEVEGRPAHSSNPVAGVNAVDGAVELCGRLRALPLPVDPDLGAATLAVTSIHSGPDAPHTVPAWCRLTLDRRLVPGEDPAQAVAQIASLAQDIRPPRVTVRTGDVSLPGKLPPDHPLSRLVTAAARDAEVEAPPFYRRAALDAGYFLSRGLPALMWGPGDPSLAHTDEERVNAEAARRVAQAYCRCTELACWDEPDRLG